MSRMVVGSKPCPANSRRAAASRRARVSALRRSLRVGAGCSAAIVGSCMTGRILNVTSFLNICSTMCYGRIMPLAPHLVTFLSDHRVGVLATVSADGRPRQSLVYYAFDGDRLLVSTVADRWKARDVERTGWASLAVRGDEPPYPSATIAGPAAIVRDDVPRLTALVAQRVMG